MTSIEYRIGVGLGVPVVLVVIGIIGKRLVRGPSDNWRRSDFYLGVELTLAGVSTALLNICEFFKPSSAFKPSELVALGINTADAFFGIVFFLFVLTLHQSYEGNSTKSRTKELLMLAVLANVLGLCVLLASVLTMSA